MGDLEGMKKIEKNHKGAANYSKVLDAMKNYIERNDAKWKCLQMTLTASVADGVWSVITDGKPDQCPQCNGICPRCKKESPCPRRGQHHHSLRRPNECTLCKGEGKADPRYDWINHALQRGKHHACATGE